MTVLETFLYDPLCEWSKYKRSTTGGVATTREESGEQENERAAKILFNIDRKLRGYTAISGLPLSVQGHVDELINAAVDPQNLCQMYIGWAAYL